MVDALGAFLVFVAVLIVPIGLRFAIAFARADDDNAIQTAFERTGRWAYGIAGAAAGVVGMGFVEFGDLVAEVVGFVGGHPYFASNFAITGLGAGVVSGMVSLSTDQFIGIALMIVGVVFVVVEVDRSGA